MSPFTPEDDCVSQISEEDIPTKAIMESIDSLQRNTKESAPDHQSEKKRNTLVSFGNIEIREYARCLGNNPATTHGASLAIDWKYENVGTYTVDEFEETRPPRRVANQMLVPATLREEILLEHTNTTKRQLTMNEAELKGIRHRRQMTVAMQDFEQWHIFFESMTRKFRRFRTGVTKKREEEILWENAKNANKLKDVPSIDTAVAEADIVPENSR